MLEMPTKQIIEKTQKVSFCNIIPSFHLCLISTYSGREVLIQICRIEDCEWSSHSADLGSQSSSAAWRKIT